MRAMLTMAALSLSEFVDSMIVSNLLGENALAIVQFGYPVVLLASSCYVLIGNGGSTLYSIAIGERNRDNAGKIFTLSMITALILGLVILAGEFCFLDPIADFICKNKNILADFKQYLFALLFSTPILILFLSFLFFLPPSGAPVMATVANVIANVVNISMDYVYVHMFNMGVQGAAWATLTGYLVAIVGEVPLPSGIEIPLGIRIP